MARKKVTKAVEKMKVDVPKKSAATKRKAKKESANEMEVEAPKKATARKRKAKEEPANEMEVEVPKKSTAAKRKAKEEPATDNKNAKRGRPVPNSSVASKKPKLEPWQPSEKSGVVLTLGQGDTGQLGLGEDIMERSKPAVVKDLENVVQVCAGGMHTVCLTKNGEVFTFGCNDEGSLGRTTDEDEECFTPGKVNIDGKVKMISAGDSHSVALTEEGKTFYWGTFRDSSGSFGLTPEGQIEKFPVALAPHLKVVKIASGSDHVVLLTEDGALFSLGTAEQGQLGRISERFVARGGRRGIEFLLKPDIVHSKNRKIVFKDVWAGSYSTYALTQNDEILVCGLNNYNQLGIAQGQLFFTLTKSPSFTEIAQSSGWKNLAMGQHHVLGLDTSGQVHAIGRMEYGRLGLGKELKADATVPTTVKGIEGKASEISCGTAVSFACTENGNIFSWGMGTNGQLGHGGDDEDVWAPKKVSGKQLETRKVLAVSGGGQHTVILASDN